MSGQTFIFCVGATKAGTSWLYDYLNSHRECQLPAVKELHYFDALEHGSGAWHRKQLEERLDGVRARLAAEDTPKPHQQAPAGGWRRLGWTRLTGKPAMTPPI